MAVHTHPSIPCPICGFGLKDQSIVLPFLKFVNENEEPIKVEMDPEDPEIKSLQGAGLLPKRISDDSLDDRIQELFGAIGADEAIQAKVQELKNMLEELVAKYVDDDEMEEPDWTQAMEWLHDKARSDPDEIDILEWYLLGN